jgi:hypothetical protein
MKGKKMHVFRIFTMRALIALTLISSPSMSFAGVSVGLSIAIAPPILPVYEQPLIPGPDYIWTPGYWAYGDDGYYWVPGTWLLPPSIGLLWTPGYWAYDEGFYSWHAGYWGPHVGYYGGINYGCGYFGLGYEGGYWSHGAFFYNTAVTNVNTTIITNTYNKTVINNVTVNNVSFNGGTGGTKAQPTPQELAWSREQHTSPTALQMHHEQAASTNHALFASVNHGRPPIAATAKPGVFAGPDTVAAKALKATNQTTFANGAPSHKASPHGPVGPGGPSAQGGPGPHGGPYYGPGRPYGPGGPGGPSAQGGPGPHGRPHGPDKPHGPGGPAG